MGTKRRKAVIIVVLVLAVGIAAGVGWLAWRPISPVTVVVRNDSQKRIASVRLEHERGVEIAENLGRGEAKTIRFQAGGETPIPCAFGLLTVPRSAGTRNTSSQVTNLSRRSAILESRLTGVCRHAI